MWGVFSRKRWKRAGATERASGSRSLGVLGDPGLRQYRREGGPDPKVLEKHKGAGGGAGLREGVQPEEGVSSVKG